MNDNQKIEFLNESVAKITFPCSGRHITEFFTKGSLKKSGFMARNGSGIMSYFSNHQDSVTVHTEIGEGGSLEQVVMIPGIREDERNRDL